MKGGYLDTAIDLDHPSIHGSCTDSGPSILCDTILVNLLKTSQRIKGSSGSYVVGQSAMYSIIEKRGAIPEELFEPP